MVKASICIASYDKPGYLEKVLASIYRQKPPFAFEVIVVDDGSPDRTTRYVSERYPLLYERIDRLPTYRNPSAARNVAYKLARGEVVICQSDDVVHGEPTTIEKLVKAVVAGKFAIARVLNTDWDGFPRPCEHPNNPSLVELTGPQNRRPLFFLGALLRSDLYAIGGCEEKFTAPGRDDVYFVDCLRKGLGLTPVFLRDVTGWHLHHPRPARIDKLCKPSAALYRELIAASQWIATGGPWSYE